MPHPHKPVAYDFAAAADIIWALGYLSEKLHDLNRKRRELGGSDLDCPDHPAVSVPWRGNNRDEFDAKVGREHAELTHLADEARRLQTLVQAATDSAQRAHSGSR
ncbi:hypothetical protein [Streptomyces sp. NBC_01190]|uniref:hypothetical protein n=1 Tax=Streptomyces sp. NBC_01190 TaxID=2903767 RepID=UPI0038677527|nr:hypothetical protein OG519_16200 [Streptomyces sp. NBC_01190]